MSAQDQDDRPSQVSSEVSTQGAEFQVVCITRERTRSGGSRIAKLGIRCGREPQLLSVEEVVRRIHGGEQFYVWQANHKAYLRVNRVEGHEYVETIRDETTQDNLETLPLCDEPRSWWLLLLQGITATILGLIVLGSLLSHAVSAETIVILIGVYWLVSGIIALLRISTGDSKSHWALSVLIGVLGILAGILAILAQSPFLGTIAILGLGMGVLEIIRFLGGDGKEAIVLGILSILIGLLLFVPIVLVGFALGLVLLAAGVTLFFWAIRLPNPSPNRLRSLILILLLGLSLLACALILFLDIDIVEIPPTGIMTVEVTRQVTVEVTRQVTVVVTTTPCPCVTPTPPPTVAITNPKGMALTGSETNSARLLVSNWVTKTVTETRGTDIVTSTLDQSSVVVFAETEKPFLTQTAIITGFDQPFDIGIVNNQAFVSEVGKVGVITATGAIGVINLDTLTKTDTITTTCGQRPTHIAVNASTNRVYVTLDSSGLVSVSPDVPAKGGVVVIDATTRQAIGCVPAGKHPFGIAANRQFNQFYVGDRESDTLWIFGGDKNTELGKYSLGANAPGARGAYHVALSPDQKRLYVVVDVGINAPHQILAYQVVATEPYLTFERKADIVNTHDGGWVMESSCSGLIYIAGTNLNSNYQPLSGVPEVLALNHDLSFNKVLSAAENIGSQPFGLAQNPNLKRIYIASKGEYGKRNGRITMITEPSCTGK